MESINKFAKVIEKAYKDWEINKERRDQLLEWIDIINENEPHCFTWDV